MPNPPPSLNPASFTGVRVWLSGSLPETRISTEKERADILEFVSHFSARVFQLGGHIIHGSDPTFTPTLLEQARAHQGRGGKKDSLILAVSRFWSDRKSTRLNSSH